MENINGYEMKKNIWNGKMIGAVIAISVMSFVMIVGMICMIAFGTFLNIGSAEGNSGGVVSMQEPVLIISSCPESVNSNNPSFTAEGVMVSDTGSCTLYINGERIAATTTAGEQLKWSQTYYMSGGETRDLTFELVDSNGTKKTETRTVYCQVLQNVPKLVSKPITRGCSLVKKKAGGLNIREYPGTSYDVIDFIQSYDYTSTMTYTGYYCMASDGYVWYEVISPKGKCGYVRSDLVANYQYVY